MTKANEVNTNNEGDLTIIKPFTFLRGAESEGVKMGQAKNKKGEVFDIYPACCNLPNCYCWATAKKIKK